MGLLRNLNEYEFFIIMQVLYQAFALHVSSVLSSLESLCEFLHEIVLQQHASVCAQYGHGC